MDQKHCRAKKDSIMPLQPQKTRKDVEKIVLFSLSAAFSALSAVYWE
jgi:hypothetical protein